MTKKTKAPRASIKELKAILETTNKSYQELLNTNRELEKEKEFLAKNLNVMVAEHEKLESKAYIVATQIDSVFAYATSFDKPEHENAGYAEISLERHLGRVEEEIRQLRILSTPLKNRLPRGANTEGAANGRAMTEAPDVRSRY